MIRENTLNTNEMHAINRSAILDIIRRLGPISRPSIANHLQISLPTVIRTIDELISEDMVVQTDEKESTGGRKRPLLKVNSDVYAIIGVDLGGTSIYGAATDLSGKVLAEIETDNHPASSEKSYLRLRSLIDHLINDKQIEDRKILGIAVGTQGLTSHQNGTVILDHIQNWQDFPLRAKLNQEFQVPVVIDNDVYLAALGEFWFGVGQNARNLVFITIGNGIGAGIIIDGALYRSSNYLAGEVGYYLPGLEYLGKKRGDFGVLESLASLPATSEKAYQLLHANGSKNMEKRSSAEGIFQAMLDHEPWAESIVADLIDYLALAVANTCAVLDPDMIVIRSGLDAYTNFLTEKIYQRIEGVVPTQPVLVASELGYQATPLGAIVEVLYETNNFYTIRKLR